MWAIYHGGPEGRAHPVYDLLGGFRGAFAGRRWLAFQSDESDRNEVYVQFEGATAGTKRRWLVSSGGGGLPRWRADGAEMFYITSGGRMMAVALHPAGGEFQFEPAHMLFQTRPFPRRGTSTTSLPTASGSCSICLWSGPARRPSRW